MSSKSVCVKKTRIPISHYRLQATLLELPNTNLLWLNCYFPNDTQDNNFDQGELLEVLEKIPTSPNFTRFPMNRSVLMMAPQLKHVDQGQGRGSSGIRIFSASTEDSETSLKDEDDKSEWTPSERLNSCGPRALESSRFHLILEDKVKKLLRNHLNILQ